MPTGTGADFRVNYDNCTETDGQEYTEAWQPVDPSLTREEAYAELCRLLMVGLQAEKEGRVRPYEGVFDEIFRELGADDV